MLERLKSVFRSDDFIPTAAVFPDIDAEKIARDLKLEENGKARGEKKPAAFGNDRFRPHRDGHHRAHRGAAPQRDRELRDKTPSL